MRPRELERFFLDRGLDVYTPKAQNKPHHWWVQLKSGPYDLEHNIPLLMKIADDLRAQRVQGEQVDGRTVVAKLDSTRDIRGSFFAPMRWKDKHKELGNALEKEFGIAFKDNGNSFNSCFQFEGCFAVGSLRGRIKYYWKTLALVQSESVTQSVGMNMKALYYPSIRMGQALRESRDEG